MPQILCHGQGPVPARPDRAIALGAALFIADLRELPKDFDLVAVAEANPWAVVAARKPEHDGHVAAWRRHPPLRGLIALDCAEAKWDAALRAELASLGAPEPKEVVACITARRPDPTFERALLTELLGHSRPRRSARHAAFSRRGPLTGTDWRGLYTICRALSLPGPRRISDAAAQLAVDPRSLQTHCRNLLALDFRDAHRGFGWKWAVERALRLHGYVADSPPLPLGFWTAYGTHRSRRAGLM